MFNGGSKPPRSPNTRDMSQTVSPKLILFNRQRNGNNSLLDKTMFNKYSLDKTNIVKTSLEKSKSSKQSPSKNKQSPKKVQNRYDGLNQSPHFYEKQR